MHSNRRGHFHGDAMNNQQRANEELTIWQHAKAAGLDPVRRLQLIHDEQLRDEQLQAEFAKLVADERGERTTTAVTEYERG